MPVLVCTFEVSTPTAWAGRQGGSIQDLELERYQLKIQFQLIPYTLLFVSRLVAINHDVFRLFAALIISGASPIHLA